MFVEPGLFLPGARALDRVKPEQNDQAHQGDRPSRLAYRASMGDELSPRGILHGDQDRSNPEEDRLDHGQANREEE